MENNTAVNHKTREFTVLATSGWQGDEWSLIAITEDRKIAEKIATAIQSTDAKRTGHLVAVCGQAKLHPTMNMTYIVDTSRVRVNESHLRSKRCTVDATSFLVEEGPHADLIAIAQNIIGAN